MEMHLIDIFILSAKKLEIGLAVIGVAGLIVEVSGLDQSRRSIRRPMHNYFLSLLHWSRMNYP